MNWHEAVNEMYKGNVVQYIGTVNGNVWADRGCCFAMQRGVIFEYKNGKVYAKTFGSMVYDPDFRYKLTGETVNTKDWPEISAELSMKLDDLIESFAEKAYTPYSERRVDLKAFTILVVNECLAQVDKVDEMLEDDNEKLGASWVGLAIAKRFGVE